MAPKKKKEDRKSAPALLAQQSVLDTAVDTGVQPDLKDLLYRVEQLGQRIVNANDRLILLDSAFEGLDQISERVQRDLRRLGRERDDLLQELTVMLGKK